MIGTRCRSGHCPPAV
jgi:hypothetical protein